MNSINTNLNVTTKALAASILLSAFTISTQASTLLVDTGQLPTLDTRTPNATFWGTSALIKVGNNPVNIDQFSMYGQQLADGNVRFDIFDMTGITFTGGTPNSPVPRVYDSGSITTSASGSLQWYSSPNFNLTLNANGTYYLGLISDQQFTYTWAIPSPTSDLGLGLSAPFSDGSVRGINGNFSNFSDPVFFRTAWAQESIRVYGTPAAVPIPSAFWMFGTAIAGLAAKLRRKTV